jgi:hypothetical protein
VFTVRACPPLPAPLLSIPKPSTNRRCALSVASQYSSAAVKKFCDYNDIRLDTSVAKEEHRSNGNKLGIIDRLVRTLRELIEKYFDITGHRTDNIKDVMKTIVDTYNNSNHRTLNNKTPFNSGDQVRILEKKEKFDKGKQKFSKELYTINKKEGYKLIIKDEKIKLKPSELLSVKNISNPISQTYIDNKIKSKTNK